MATTWTLKGLEIVGLAKRARVEHTMPDGSVRVREYSWPATITRDEIIRTLDALHKQLLAEPAQPAQIDDAMDLVNQPREG